MTYEELVEKVKKAYGDVDASSVSEHVAFQFNIEGEAAGAFYLEIADGKVNVEPYEYFDRDVLVTTSAETLLEIAEGKLDPVKAFLMGKIKAQGNLGKAAFLKELSAKQEKKPAQKPEKKAQESKTAELKETEKTASEVKVADKPAAAVNATEKTASEVKEADKPAAAVKPAAGKIVKK